MTTPGYANEPTFRILCSFCEMLGISLRFSNVKESRLGQFSGSKTFEIAMRTNEIEPSQVLANKIAQYLLWNVYIDYDRGGSQVIKSCRDQIGLGIYMLAENIASNVNTPKDNISFATKISTISGFKKVERRIKYLSVQQAAERLGVSTATVYHLIKDSKLTANKISSRKILIDEYDLDMFAKGAKQ